MSWSWVQNISIKKMVHRSLFAIHLCFLRWWLFQAACCILLCFSLSRSVITLAVTCNNCCSNRCWIIGCRVRSSNWIIGVLITRRDHCRCWGFVQWILCERRSCIIYHICGNWSRMFSIGWILRTLIWTLVRFLAKSRNKTLNQYFTQLDWNHKKCYLN